MHAFDTVVVGFVALLLAHRFWDARVLAAFVRSAPGEPDARQAALGLAAACHKLPVLGRDPVLLPFLPALGATPGAVLRRGGCCSGQSRLLILALARLGIRAFQITLYHVAGHAQHCLVQAWVDDKPLILDPAYGLYYADQDGFAIGLTDLQAGVVPHLKPLPGALASAYPSHPYYDFDFRGTRTANWTRSASRRLAYRGLRVLVGSRADRVEVPAVLEWPQHLAASALLSVTLALHLVAGL